MHLNTLISPDSVLLLKETKKAEAIARLVSTVPESAADLPREEIQEKLLAREELMSTGIGLGLGIPHIRAAGIKTPVLRVGVQSLGISDYESIDGLPVKILFMILLKEDQQREHVALLSEIVSLMKIEQLRIQLSAVSTSAQGYRLLHEHLNGMTG
ncbi:PTS sugar transporter subunit IIA [Marispirochaeta sp.]|jgi:nitrogen PTS system EIIA component|uniref:PTS sugar transporter subunit IIA n=1 Tax=Marispirochaeta sp. TaxID=2038653 RepID=UPI0029C9B116|nr:PTS sugar transporter subunit IIA [Marispirochaeta sp.]